MHDEIERMVERAECHDHADGLVPGERQATGRGIADSHGNHVSALRAQRFHAYLDTIDRTVHFHE